MKRVVKWVITRPILARFLIRWALRLNNFSYKLVSFFAPFTEESGLHPKHRIMRYHDWFVGRIEPSWSVIDVGCGNGALASSMAKKAKKVSGIDINPNNVRLALERNPGMVFLCGDATRHPFTETFDAVVLSNVLEHVEDRVGLLKSLQKISRRFLIRVPLITRDWMVPYKKEMGLEYRLDGTHFTEYTEEEFAAEAKAAGLRILTQESRWGELYVVLEVG